MAGDHVTTPREAAAANMAAQLSKRGRIGHRCAVRKLGHRYALEFADLSLDQLADLLDRLDGQFFSTEPLAIAARRALEASAEKPFRMAGGAR